MLDGVCVFYNKLVCNDQLISYYINDDYSTNGNSYQSLEK